MPTKEFYEASEKLKRILGNTRCPMCGNNQFAIAEGYTTIPIQRSLNEFQIGGPSTCYWRFRGNIRSPIDRSEAGELNG